MSEKKIIKSRRRGRPKKYENKEDAIKAKNKQSLLYYYKKVRNGKLIDDSNNKILKKKSKNRIINEIKNLIDSNLLDLNLDDLENKKLDEIKNIIISCK